MASILLVPVVTNLLAAIIAVAVGLRLVHHRPQGDAGRAVARFGTWWIGLATYILANQVATIAGLAGVAAPSLYAALTYASMVALAAALWGLVSYVAYLFTGRRTVFLVVTVLYAIQLVVVLAWIASLGPRGIVITGTGSQTLWTNEPSPGEGALFALFLLLPPLLSSVAIGILRSRTKDKTARYRMAAISVGIFVWFTLAILISGAGEPTLASTVGGPIVGTLCMLLIVSAYLPPAFLRARGIEPFGVDARRPRAAPRKDDEEMLRRVRELV